MHEHEDQCWSISFINALLPDCFLVLHQSGMLASNKLLQGSPGSCLRQLLSHPVWLACSYLPKWAKIKIPSAWFSRSKWGWSESSPCRFFSSPSHHCSLFFSPLLVCLLFSTLCLNLSPFLHLLVIFIFFYFLWISAHCATRKCTSRGCQLLHCTFYLDCPEPSVYQWHQPGI